MVQFLIKKRTLLVILLIAITGVLSLGLKSAVVPDNSISVWFLEDDPKLVEYRRFHEIFGNDEVILLHVQDPNGIFQPKLLRKLQALSTELEAQEGVHRVFSILSSRDVFDTDEGLQFRKLLPDKIPDDPEPLTRAQKRATDNRLFTDRLISPDGTQAMFWIQMEVTKDFDNQRDLFVGQVQASVEKHLPDTAHALGGMGVIYTGLNKAVQRDFGIFVSITYLLMFIMLWWIFRNMKLVLATGGVITVGTITCLGIYGLMGNRLNMVTALLPTLVVVLGIADAVHFPASLLKELRATPGDRDGALHRGLSRVLFPCIMTTLTTMVGFLALATSPMVAIRELGIFAAIGVGAALVACSILMTVAFVRMKEGVKLPDHPRIDGFLALCARALRKHMALVTLFVITLAGLSLYGSMNLQADTYTLAYLPDDHPVVTDHHIIEKNWGDYFPVELTVRPKNKLNAHSAQMLNAAEDFERKAVARGGIRNSVSLVSLYRRTQDVFAPSDEGHPPFTQSMVSQLQILTGNPSSDFEWDRSKAKYKDNVFANSVTQKGDLMRITLVAGMASSVEIAIELDALLELADMSFGDLATVEAAGYVPLYVQMVDYIIESQTQAFFLALILIFFLMLFWLRSLRLALISLVVNALPVGVMLTAMLTLGQDLDIASATIAAIVLGVAIDDTIHFLYHWRVCERAGMSWDESLDETYQHAGVPAVITTVLLMVGFPVLMLASVKSVFFFGLLTTIAAFAALLCDLLVLPLLLKAWPARNVRTAGENS
jgi:predicted RND superfamily exporter protein